MNTLRIFFGEFWPAFVGVSVSLSFVWLARRFASDGYLPFIGPKSFTELADYSKEEQNRLLHEATAEAFRHWRSFLPGAVLAICFATGAAIAHTLPRFTTIPDSPWITLPLVMVFAGFGAWLAGTLTTRCVRPFLRACIEKSHHG